MDRTWRGLSRMVAIALLALPLGGCFGRAGEAIRQGMAVNDMLAGAAPIDWQAHGNPPDIAAAAVASRQACMSYLNYVSSGQRGARTGLSLTSTGIGALGLAFVPAGAATIASFTAAQTIVSAMAASQEENAGLGLGTERFVAVIRKEYDQRMQRLQDDIERTPDLLSPANFARMRFRLNEIHAVCSRSFVEMQVDSALR